MSPLLQFQYKNPIQNQRDICIAINKNVDTFFALPSNTKLAVLGSTKKESENFQKK